MGVGDWFLARSQAFKILVDKFREHRSITKRSFTKVKTRHSAYEYILEGHEARLREMEDILKALKKSPVKVIKRKKR